MSKYLVIDFETVDPYLTDLGPGWTYMKSPNNKFQIIGYSYCFVEDGTTSEVKWSVDIDELFLILEETENIVAHNGMYDFGILAALGYDLKKFNLFDTMHGMKLFNNELNSYSLDYLGKKYLKKEKKNKEMFVAFYKDKEFTELGKAIVEKIENDKPLLEKEEAWYRKQMNYIKTHMDEVYEQCPQVLINYANFDVELCAELHTLLLRNISPKHYKFWGDILRICIGYRKNGMVFNIQKAISLSQHMEHELERLKSEVYNLAGGEFNYNSGQQIACKLQELGIILTVKTDSGQFKTDTATLKTIKHPLAAKIIEVKAVTKLKNDFVDTPINTQYTYFGLEGSQSLPGKGRVFPMMLPLAARTGRFSCSKPNLQQTPGRDEHWGPLIRGLYEPEQGQTLYDLDFSAQEPRLAIHLAKKAGIVGIDLLVAAFNKDPTTDMHQITADLIGIDRKTAKTINLGLMYGMGAGKLGKSLGKSEEETKEILDKYNMEVPYIKELSKLYQSKMKADKYVLTLDGRRCQRPKPIFFEGEMKELDYQALNRVIQGSAAGQTAISMWIADKVGLNVLLSIHDEMLLSARCPEEALLLKHIMERSYKLVIPSLTEILEGSSWGEAKFSKGK